jgi:prepilin signal peptidase PulO-like enzyme (type II secretory pathway)
VSSIVLLLTALAGLALAWAMTVPLHRYKELRPLTPRDVASESGSTEQDDLPVIRASYRRARCPRCHHECTWRDVAPVRSWVRGCPECATPLPRTVALLQLGLPLAMVLTVVALPGTWAVVPYLFLVVVLAAISIVDLRIWLIPYWMPWAGAGVGLVLISIVSISWGQPRDIAVAVAGAVGTFLMFFVLFVVAPGKLGFGDVRLALLLGLFLAWINPILPVYGLLFGAVLGLLMGVVALLARGDSRFPFGPALALGAMAAVWLHQPILGSLG